MADQILTDLTQFAGEIAGDDWLYFVDTSDDTDDLAGSSFKIQVQNIMARVPFETITNATAGEFDFSTIPTGGKRIVFEGKVRGDVTATQQPMRVFINADTTDANYHYQQIFANNSSSAQASESGAAFAGIAPAVSSPANSYGRISLTLEDYDSATTLKTIEVGYRALLDTDAIRIGTIYIASDSITAAITRVRLRTNNHDTEQLLGEMTGYVEF